MPKAEAINGNDPACELQRALECKCLTAAASETESGILGIAQLGPDKPSAISAPIALQQPADIIVAGATCLDQHRRYQ